jgi:hypothetical protein
MVRRVLMLSGYKDRSARGQRMGIELATYPFPSGAVREGAL